MLGLEFQRASALFLLALPLVLWLLARRPRPPHERATGTLDIWREVLERSAARPTTRGRGVPPGLYALFLGLALGALALAGPRTHREAAPEWRVVLDTRASMYLPWREEAQSAGEDRRIDVALRAAREWIDGPALWTRFDGAHWESVRGLEPPPDWLRATNRTTTAMPWSEVDRADALWVTDRAPESREASWCASGGAHVDGIVGRVDGRLVELRDGARIELGAASPVRLVLDASLPRELRGLSEAWARERGIELVASGADLRVGSGASREGARVVLGDGWQLSGAAAQEPAGEVLWRDREGAAALATRTGQLQLALTDPLAIEGDRRAFALAWIDALESSVPPPPGAVAPAERRAAGPGGRHRGAGPGPPADSRHGTLASWLALAAALLVGLGLRAGALRV